MWPDVTVSWLMQSRQKKLDPVDLRVQQTLVWSQQSALPAAARSCSQEPPLSPGPRVCDATCVCQCLQSDSDPLCVWIRLFLRVKNAPLGFLRTARWRKAKGRRSRWPFFRVLNRKQQVLLSQLGNNFWSFSHYYSWRPVHALCQDVSAVSLAARLRLGLPARTEDCLPAAASPTPPTVQRILTEESDL